MTLFGFVYAKNIMDYLEFAITVCSSGSKFEPVGYSVERPPQSFVGEDFSWVGDCLVVP